MIALLIILLPLVGAIVSLLSHRLGRTAPRWTALGFMVAELLMIVYVWENCLLGNVFYKHQVLSTEFHCSWIPLMGISFSLALDNLGFVFAALTALLGVLAALSAWKQPYADSGPFYANLLCMVAAIMGVFVAADLFLFYIFWELMIIPTYFLIALWGRENRVQAAMKFFIFSQAGAIFLLFSILGLYFVHGRATGQYTFDYHVLLHTQLSARAALLLMLGFFISFSVKLGIVPFHGWLPDAYEQAPVGAGLILAGVMAKTGAYGLIRFCLPLFPTAAHSFAIIALVIGIVSIIYGATMAFSQSTITRVIAYSSISHMGFVLIGIFVWSALSVQGAIVQMVSHGVCMAGIFMLSGMLFDRMKSNAFSGLGGLWADAPGLCSMFLIFIFALMGIPGSGNFVGEFLVLVEAFRISPTIAALGALGAVFSALYALKLLEGVVQGKKNIPQRCSDLNNKEMTVLGVLVVLLLGIGLFPNPLFAVNKPPIDSLLEASAPNTTCAGIIVLKGDNP